MCWICVKYEQREESVTIIWVGRKLLNDLMSLLFSSFCVKFPALCLQGGVQIRHLHPRSGDHFDVVFVFKCFEIIWAGCGWLALVHLMFLLQSFIAEQNDLIRVHTCQRESVLQSLTEDRTSACWFDRYNIQTLHQESTFFELDLYSSKYLVRW